MASPLRYDGGLTCALQVSNLARSIGWYQDVLGFTLLYKVDEIGWAELATEVNRVNVGLSEVEAANIKPGKANAIMTFGVVDIAHARGALEKKDVRFDGPTMTIEGMVKLATFFDPDGNALMFFQDLQKQP
jgi:predicted enzyme related to lactoylglutathione lyase